jgi:hypothetical protein
VTDSQETAQVEFELTPEEWVEVSLQHSSKSPQVREAMRKVRILFGALVVLAVLISLLDGGTTAAVIWAAAGTVVMAVMGPVLRASRRKQVTQYAESGIANGMFGPHRVELRPEGMLDSTDGYEWLTRWSAIERVEEGEGAFLVYTGPNALLPIPHSAFRDSASLRSFSAAFYALRERSQGKELSEGAAETGD